MYIILFILFILWTFFGSFATVLISRWKSGKSGIMMGRSECPQCDHTLSWKELFPIFSYIFQWGKCKNCHHPISAFYPLSELLMGGIFLIMGYVFFQGNSELFSPSMLLLLFLGFTTGVYILYDIRYTEIPDQIMVPALWLYSILLIGGLFIPSWEVVLFDRDTYTDMTTLVRDHIFAAVILYTFFYIQILIPGSIFFGKNGDLKKIGSLLLSYILFPIELFVSFFTRKKEEDTEEEMIPSWIGWGDLRIALFIGITLGVIHGVIAFFLAYLIGSIVWIFILMKKWRKNSQIAFGPFLGIGWLIVIFFHWGILEAVQKYFI